MSDHIKKQELADYISRTTGHFAKLTSREIEELYQMMLSGNTDIRIRNRLKEMTG